MDTFLNILGPVFWGLLVLSTLVFVHEGGHFLAARACGVRVTEFFLGMPCRFNLHRTSKRNGTTFGVTPILLGGYAAICGMDPTPAPHAAALLSLVHRRGSISAWQAQRELGISGDDLANAAGLLQDWGSITCEEVEAASDTPEAGEEAYVLHSVPRDAHGNTLLDGRAFDRERATAPGEAWEPVMGEQAFFERERARTYQGQGFWKRAFMLVAGIAVNIVTGFLLVVVVYSVIGVDVSLNTNVLGEVLADSPAAQAGLVEGDRILSVDGTDIASWTELTEALRAHGAGETLSLTYEDADGSRHETQVTLDDDGSIGIFIRRETVHLNPIDSCSIAVDNIILTAQSVAQLVNPQHTKEVLDNSTSVVGISILSSQAAAAGVSTFLNFAALISFSLGFMNLLPIPPLDGGKLVIEIIQALTRREVPLKIQNAISIAGVALFLALFVYMLRADIMRFF